MRPLRPVAPMLSLAASLAWLALAPGPALADSIRCQGGLVGLGDTKLDLLGKCGRPALAEPRTVERGELISSDDQIAISRVAAVPVETWTYDFGPRRFLQIVTLEAGRVTAVNGGSYGYAEGGEDMAQAFIPRARCGHLSIHEGDRTYDLLAKCGEPATRDVTVVRQQQQVVAQEPAAPRPAPPAGPERPRPGGTGLAGSRGGPDHLRPVTAVPVLVQGVTTTTTLEVWAYDFGPQVLVRLVGLRDGVVTSVGTGSHGYSR